MMFLPRIFLAAAALLLAVTSVASAQNSLRAAAVVNDQIVSELDLMMRLRIAMVSSGLQDSPETRQRLVPPVLRQLIDERLQLQEAARLEIEVPEDEIKAAFAEIARNNRMEPEQFRAALKQGGILPVALENQIHAQLAWQAVVARRLRPTVQIGEEEIDATVTRLRESEGQLRVRVSEIYLAYDNPAEEDQVRATAQRLMEQLGRGADFGAVARQFSASATASVGGDLGWLLEGELAPELQGVVSRMQPGQLAGPVPAIGGFYLVALRDRQKVSFGGDVQLRLSQILFPAPPGQEQAVIAEAARATESVASCAEAETLGQELGSTASGSLGDVKLSELPAELQQSLRNLPIGQPSEPQIVPGGVAVFVVCLRQEEGGIDRERIAQGLLRERLELLSRRYMRDLRRSANVDIRA